MSPELRLELGQFIKQFREKSNETDNPYNIYIDKIFLLSEKIWIIVNINGNILTYTILMITSVILIENVENVGEKSIDTI